MMGLLWVIIPSGAIVRLTGSGLGCSDWPLCNSTGVVPPLDAHGWIEYSNRMLSAVTMVIVVLAAIVVSASPTAKVAAKIGAVVAALAAMGQIPLGAVTVYFDLHPMLVASHFTLSLVALAAAVIAFLEAGDVVRGIVRRWAGRALTVALLAAAALITTVVTGVLVTSAGPHSGDPDVVKRFGSLDTAAYVHVRAVIALGVMALAALVLVRWRRGDRGLMLPAAWFIPLFLTQVVIGEVQWRNELPWQLVAVHVSLAGLVWATGVATLWRLAHPVTSPPRAPNASDRTPSLGI